MPPRRGQRDLVMACEDLRTATGRPRLMRQRHGPERKILTGIGPVAVPRPKARNRGGKYRIRLCRRGPADAVSVGGIASGFGKGALPEVTGRGAWGPSPGVQRGHHPAAGGRLSLLAPDCSVVCGRGSGPTALSLAKPDGSGPARAREHRPRSARRFGRRRNADRRPVLPVGTSALTPR